MEEYTNDCKNCSKEPAGRINVSRFISALDECFSKNDLAMAGKLIDVWAEEAKALDDERGLLSVYNEGLGYYRRTGDEEKAMATVEAVDELIKSVGIADKVSGATIYVNLATTLKAFGRVERALKYYSLAENVYLANDMQSSFEYSALLNNRASAFGDLKKYDDAELNLLIATEILKEDGTHDAEVAVGLINLAHCVYDRNENDTDRVEKLLDEAWDYLNSSRCPRDAGYAFIISKCAPSLRYFNRVDEAEALEAVAAVIYGKK
ncbi:MAG: tetratricopeptide repeat protein [Clostridia bacterium]|nr:tetratricopeptide repeat protein [Clostridia bacterium]